MEITGLGTLMLGKPNVSRETSVSCFKKCSGQVVIVPNKPYSDVMKKEQEMETKIAEVARLAEELREALKGLTGPSGRMSTWWDGQPQDWPENSPWSADEVARANDGLGSLTLSEEDEE